MYERVEKNIKGIRKNQKLSNLLKSAASEIKLNKKSRIQYLFSLCIALFLSYITVYKSNTVSTMLNAVEVINNSSLAIIAIIFGTYAIFQALMTDAVIWAMLDSENNLLNIGNKSFLHLILLYWIEIMVNVVLLIFLKALPEEFCLIDNLIVTNFIAFFLSIVYFTYCFLLFYELKNFAVNLFQMFNVYNICRGLEVLGKKYDEELEDEELP